MSLWGRAANCLAVAVLALWLAVPAHAGVTFAGPTSFPAGSAPLDVAVADFNGDHDPDLAVTGAFPSGSASILLGSAGASFGAPTAYPVGRTPVAMATGDFNGDHDPDLAVANQDSNSVSVLLGGAGGSFGAATDYGLGTGTTEIAIGIAVADFNEDGDPDLVAGGWDAHAVVVFLGGAGGTFGAPTPFGVGARPASIGVGDFNGDHHIDLVTPNEGDDTFSVLMGKGNGTFDPQTRYAATFDDNPEAVAVGDFNRDGHPDIAMTNLNAASVSVWLGGASGTFSGRRTYPVGGGAPLSIVADDFDRDGNLDLAVGHGSGIDLLPGEAAGTFGPATHYATPFPHIADGDFNGDGTLDLVGTDRDNHAAFTLLNTGVSVEPGGIDFPTTALGEQSAQTVKLTNTRASGLVVSGVSVNGTGASSYSTSNDTCTGTTVPAGGSCSVDVRFAPGTLGAKPASLQFADDALGSPQTVPLSGTGIAPVTLTPSSWDFGPSPYQTATPFKAVQFRNDSAGDVTISGVALSGDTNSFIMGNDTCTGATLPSRATCSVAVRFRPGALGGRAVNLTFTDSAAGSPRKARLSGTGISPVTVSPLSIAYGSRPDHYDTAFVPVTVTNIGAPDLVVSDVALVGPDASSYLLGSNTCKGATLHRGASCEVSVRFRPLGAGPKVASLQLTDSAPDSPHAVALSGTGTPRAWLATSLQGLKFGRVAVGTTSATKTVDLTNVGSAPMTIDAVTIEGVSPGDFTGLSLTCTTPITLDPGDTCTARVAFRPTAAGTRSATLAIADSAPRHPHQVALQGTGT